MNQAQDDYQVKKKVEPATLEQNSSITIHDESKKMEMNKASLIKSQESSSVAVTESKKVVNISQEETTKSASTLASTNIDDEQCGIGEEGIRDSMVMDLTVTASEDAVNTNTTENNSPSLHFFAVNVDEDTGSEPETEIGLRKQGIDVEDSSCTSTINSSECLLKIQPNQNITDHSCVDIDVKSEQIETMAMADISSIHCNSNSSNQITGSKSINAGWVEMIKTQSFDSSAPEDAQAYRSLKSLIAYSDSSSESASEDSISENDENETPLLSDESSFEDNDGDEFDSGNDTDSNCHTNKRKKKQPTDDGRLRTDGEVFPEELPPLDYLTISVGEEIQLEPLGTVSGIVDILVVIESVAESPALFDDTVLFMENRKPLGLIFETLGTVEKPFYCVRFNSNQDIVEKGINIGDRVMYAPQASNLTKYVFIAELKKAKCNDASWKDDNEAPFEVWDYSDDEDERKAKKMLWRLSRGMARSENTTEGRSKKKRRSLKRRNEEADGEVSVATNNSGLPQGPLNRNPFGDPPFQTPGKERTGRHNGQGSHQSHSSAGFTNKNSSTKSANHNGISNAWKPPQSNAQFGGKPAWQGKGGLTRPTTQFSAAPPSFQATRAPSSGPFAFSNPFTTSFNSSTPPPPLSGMFSSGSSANGPPSRPPTPSPVTFNSSTPPPPLPGMFSSGSSMKGPPLRPTPSPVTFNSSAPPPPISGIFSSGSPATGQTPVPQAHSPAICQSPIPQAHSPAFGPPPAHSPAFGPPPTPPAHSPAICPSPIPPSHSPAFGPPPAHFGPPPAYPPAISPSPIPLPSPPAHSPALGPQQAPPAYSHANGPPIMPPPPSPVHSQPPRLFSPFNYPPPRHT